MSLLDKINHPGSLLADLAAPTHPMYLASRSVVPVTSTPTVTICLTNPTCIEPCKIEESEENYDPIGDMSS